MQTRYKQLFVYVQVPSQRPCVWEKGGEGAVARGSQSEDVIFTYLSFEKTGLIHVLEDTSLVRGVKLEMHWVRSPAFWSMKPGMNHASGQTWRPTHVSRMARTPLCTQITWASLRTARSDSVGACCAHPEPAFPAGGTEAEAPGAARM